MLQIQWKLEKIKQFWLYRFIQSPAIPRRRPDITTFIHKPLEHYREVLKILMAIQGHTPPKHEDFSAISQIVHEMQVSGEEQVAMIH